MRGMILPPLEPFHAILLDASMGIVNALGWLSIGKLSIRPLATLIGGLAAELLRLTPVWEFRCWVGINVDTAAQAA